MGPVVLRAGGPDPRVCGQVRALIGAGVDVVDCDAGGIDHPDARTLDALLRLALVARRCGGRLRLLGVSERLADLLVSCGLGEVVEVVRPPPDQPKNTSASA